MPDKDKFKEFLVTDLAHADVFNEKVYVPGEENRKKLDQHLDDETNPHETTWDQTGAAQNPHGNEHHSQPFSPCPHGNECHDPDFLPASSAYVHPGTVQCNAITSYTDTPIIMHGNEWHDPDFGTGEGGGEMVIHGNNFHSPNFTDISEGNRTYYLSAGGSDSNSGTTAGTAWQTWGKVEENIPYIIKHKITVNIIGNFTGTIHLAGRVCEGHSSDGQLIIQGSTGNAQQHNVSTKIRFDGCTGREDSIIIRHIRSSGGIRITGGSCVRVDQCWITYPADSGGIRVSGGGAGIISNCVFTNVHTAIKARDLGWVLSGSNSGAATHYGLIASAGIIHKVDGTQPTGGTANESTQRGGVIY